jgi:hypothetical protein
MFKHELGLAVESDEWWIDEDDVTPLDLGRPVVRIEKPTGGPMSRVC